MSTKIFGVGLSRTGTVTLHNVVQSCGYKSVHYPMPWTNIDEYDAAFDTPVVSKMEELDKKYPNSKFIYSIRPDREDWLRSCAEHLAMRPILPNEHQKAVRISVYGDWEFDEKKWSDSYDRHEHYIRTYFEGRDQDLITVNLFDGDLIDDLYDFLQIDESKRNHTEYPHLNSIDDLSDWHAMRINYEH